jgi:hypothetical protein
MGGSFLLAAGALLLGFLVIIVYPAISPPFFRGEVLNANTATLVPEDIGAPIGLFGIDRSDTPD